MMLQGKGGSHHLYLSKPPLDLHAGTLPMDKELAGCTEEGKGKIQESRVKSQESSLPCHDCLSLVQLVFLQRKQRDFRKIF